MIHLNNITKSYQMGNQVVHALRGVSLDIHAGEFVAIMGPSGSGKSTLMNILGCLDVPTDGTYLLADIDVSNMNDNEQARVRNQRIGFVFQRFNLLARTKALKQVALPLMYSGVGASERAERARLALESVGLGERVDHKPDELSGGQQQRVAIARALVNNPKIILADEPTGALDSVSGDEVMKIFERLHQEGITVIIVTHEPEVAARTKRTIWIRDGVIVSDGPSNLVETPHVPPQAIPA